GACCEIGSLGGGSLRMCGILLPGTFRPVPASLAPRDGRRVRISVLLSPSSETRNSLVEVRGEERGTILNEKSIVELQGKIRGEVIGPGHKQYDEARKVYNAMIDKRPAAIVRCQGVADVIAATKAARAERLTIAVRGGWHSVPGFGTAEGP